MGIVSSADFSGTQALPRSLIGGVSESSRSVVSPRLPESGNGQRWQRKPFDRFADAKCWCGAIHPRSVRACSGCGKKWNEALFNEWNKKAFQSEQEEEAARKASSEKVGAALGEALAAANQKPRDWDARDKAAASADGVRRKADGSRDGWTEARRNCFTGSAVAVMPFVVPVVDGANEGDPVAHNTAQAGATDKGVA